MLEENKMKEKCLEILSKTIVICFDVEGYRRFSGDVHMAYHLGLIDDNERWEWLAKASKMVKE